jgi:hypothetical protein
MVGGAALLNMEQLLAHFLVGGLGLTLQGAVHDSSAMPPQAGRAPPAHTDPPVWAAWHSDQGLIKIHAAYDGEQSQRLGMHVVYLEWWLGKAHHEGWWRCDMKRLGEWTRGFGGEPPSRSAESLAKIGQRTSPDAAEGSTQRLCVAGEKPVASAG